MKNRKWRWLLAAVMVAAVFLMHHPKFRANLFVTLYAERIEESLAAGNGVPADDAILFGYHSVNTWEGNHTIIEFLILTHGDGYFGVYYSPDDVPVPFQNAPVELTQDGHNNWLWQAEGDNDGATSKIRDRWYYFKATF